MKIEQILIQPIGQRFNPGTLTIKTCKKTWDVDGVWYHQVVFMDDTGEIPADVKIGKYNPLHRGNKITIIVAEVRDVEYLGKPRKILYIDQYSIPTQSIAEYEQGQDQMDDELKLIVEGKIRHGIVCKTISPLTETNGIVVLTDEDKKRINALVEFVMKGE